MSAIIKEMEPEKPKDDGNKNGPTFVFYAPTFKSEEQFDTITVKDEY